MAGGYRIDVTGKTMQPIELNIRSSYILQLCSEAIKWNCEFTSVIKHFKCWKISKMEMSASFIENRKIN